MYLRLPDLYENATPVLTPNINPLKRLFEEHADALSNAANLLAGPKGGTLVAVIVEALQRPGTLGRGTKTALRRLLDILSLEHVDDFSRPEASLFASIDPASPVVEEICLLTDKLRDAMKCADAAPVQASRERAAA